MAIADQIAELTTIRGDIRTALVAKGVDASTHDFADFPNDVESIPSGGGTDGQFFPINMTEFVTPKMSLIAPALGQAYNSSITYYSDSACTIETDMSNYSDNDTITDFVYYKA